MLRRLPAPQRKKVFGQLHRSAAGIIAAHEQTRLGADLGLNNDAGFIDPDAPTACRHQMRLAPGKGPFFRDWGLFTAAAALRPTGWVGNQLGM